MNESACLYGEVPILNFFGVDPTATLGGFRAKRRQVDFCGYRERLLAGGRPKTNPQPTLNSSKEATRGWLGRCREGTVLASCGLLRTAQPLSGERIQPTAQAVGDKLSTMCPAGQWEMIQPRKGERKVPTKK